MCFSSEERHTDDKEKMNLEENGSSDFVSNTENDNSTNTIETGNDSGESAHNRDTREDKRNHIPEDAAGHIAAKRKGSLEVSLTGPTKDSSKVSAAISIAGDVGPVHEEFPRCEHPAFGKSL